MVKTVPKQTFKMYFALDSSIEKTISILANYIFACVTIHFILYVFLIRL